MDRRRRARRDRCRNIDLINGLLGTPQIHESNLGALSVAFLSDGRTAVTTGPDKKVTFWHASTGKAIRSWGGHLNVSLSPDGKTLASKGDHRDKTIRLFDLAAEKEVGQIPASNRATFRFSPDSRYLAVGGGQLIPRTSDVPLRLWAVPACKQVQQFPMTSDIQSLAFSADGRKLAAAHHNSNFPLIQLWDLASGKELHHFEEESTRFSLTSIAISPDGKMLAGVGNCIRLWDLHTGKLRWRIIVGGYPKNGCLGVDWVYSVAFSPDGKTIAVGASLGEIAAGNGIGSSVFLFETATGRQRARFDGGGSHVHSVAFSPCGLMLASIGRDCVALVWDVTGQIQASKRTPARLDAEPLGARWEDLGKGDAFKEGVVDMRKADAAEAWQAIHALVVRPAQTVSYFEKRLRPNVKMEPKRLDELFKDFDGDNFNVREKATKELVDIGPAAEPSLRKLSAGNPSDKVKACIEDLLDPAKGRIWVEERRHSRAIEVLEYIGTPEAKKLLEPLAQGEPGSQRTQDARATLERLAKRPAPSRPE
ncbi:MAG: WD40 repeat domain-containing protein [Gemmataceae bacterium]|nr:WD40 repeat domain-containing protein [Gemmataceae bacterium]